MGAIKKKIRNVFRWNKTYLEHDKPTDFYLSCWQRNRSALPLLFFRALLFLCSSGIIIYSLVASYPSIAWDYWLIYLTHWGLIMVAVSTAAATAVSCISFIKGPIDATFGLPWTVKLFWLVYNISITQAFMITVFYWAFLSNGEMFGDIEIDFALNFTLDILIHAINSVIMFLLLVTSRHPTRFMHFYQPVLFGIVYMFFSLIYYFAGGTDMFGNNFVYPMLAWDSPVITIVTVILTAVLLIILHAIVVAISEARDALAKKIGFLNDDGSFDVPTNSL